MNTSVTILLPKQQEQKLHRAAIRYGLSLPNFLGHILGALEDELPEETLSEYQSSRALKQSLTRGLADMRAGRLTETL